MADQPYSSSGATTTSSSSPASSSHARELQGPRPAPLRVGRESHRIRKPPPPVQQLRQPVIIYTVSPKVVHADPSEFRSVVQRLTGARGATPASASSSSSFHQAPPPAALHHPPRQFRPGFFGDEPSSSAVQLKATALLPPQLQFPFQLQPQEGLGAIQQQASAASSSSAPPRTRTAVGDDGSGLLPPLPGSLPAIPPSFFPSPAGAAGGGINLFGELISPAPAPAYGPGPFLGATISSTSTSSTATGAFASASSSSFPSAYYDWDPFNSHRN